MDQLWDANINDGLLVLLLLLLLLLLCCKDSDTDYYYSFRLKQISLS
jgi:hypothetical protein